MTLRVLSYNIRYGGVGRAPAIAGVIRGCDPDVVVLQEATSPGVVAQLAHETGLAHYGSQPGGSTGFLSRIPVTSFEWHRPRGTRHPFLDLLLADADVRIFGLHLSAWFNNWTERRREREIRSLLHAIREHQQGFHLIAGDFNALAPGEELHHARMPRWIQAMVWLSGRDVARKTIQVMLDQSYVDAWRQLHAEGPGHTFPTWDPHVRLDYFFTPARYGPRLTRCEVVAEGDGLKAASDHFPLLLEVGE